MRNSTAPVPASPFAPERRGDMLLGLGVLLFSFLACLVLSLWAMHEATPQEIPKPAPPSPEGVVGFPTRVKPFELVVQARALTDRTLFVGLTVRGLEKDGTLDLTDESHNVRYAFQDPRGIGRQPTRKGGTLPARTYCGKQSVRLTIEGLGAVMDTPATPCAGSGPEELPPPTCKMSVLWKIAEKKKVNPDGGVQLDYFRSRAGPAYRIKHGSKQVTISGTDCKTVLRGPDERGHVP